ncbi:MAG: tetrahydromethanopterin S-methyltransferase subunit H [Pirellulaceae bacterium]|jgi:tetrahydromethanopterin S-methyltransferase subunit H|nr:tetrahydromethanopterin S-methyltransferase subunit H [Pirellulaceae bacterium]
MTTELNELTQRGLLDFRTNQKAFEIGGVRVGGQPGVLPTVLIGSIFYHGDKIFVDEDRDEFCRDAAEGHIRMQEDFSQRTGIPGMLDVVGSTPAALQNHLEFAASVTAMPLLIDGTTAEVRLAGLKYVAEAGLSDRVVYNSIQPGVGDNELTAISEAGVECALILTYYLKDFSAKGRVQAVRELLPRLESSGIQKLIVDTCVMDLATMGQACSAIFDIKSEWGLPAGGGVHNAVAMWRGLRSKMGKQAESPCVASACAAAVAVGADFALYGPIENAKYVFPAVAMIDTALSQIAIERGGKPDENHPRYRIG